jgi:Sec-independent protein translocase protein TatA
MPFKLGPLELVLILVIVFIIFGAGKLPQIALSARVPMPDWKKRKALPRKRYGKRLPGKPQMSR